MDAIIEHVGSLLSQKDAQIEEAKSEGEAREKARRELTSDEAMAFEKGKNEGRKEAVEFIKKELVSKTHEMDWGGYVFAVLTDDIENALAAALTPTKDPNSKSL